MSVPAAAAAGAKLIPLGHRLSYEALYIHGLAPGKNRLLINDIEIGTYTSDMLESKLELESNPKTPQYRQAERVAALSAQRNTEAVAPQHMLWVGKKTLERTQRELAAAPDDETLQKRVTPYERKLADFDTNGGHGYGLRAAEMPVTRWAARAAEWLQDMGFDKKSP